MIRLLENDGGRVTADYVINERLSSQRVQKKILFS